MTNTNYSIGDFLIRIKNAAMAHRKKVEAPATTLIESVAKVLKKEGFLEDFSKKDGKILVGLAYRSKEPVLLDLKLVSTPGLRIYMGKDEMAAKRGASIYIVSTSLGMMSSKEAIKKGKGGEVLVEIW